MKILVYGAGAIGTLLIHYLCKAGNEVTVVARSTYKELKKNGIVIRHYIQKTTTVDHPRIVRKAPTDERYDIVFSVMQGQQQDALLDDLCTLNTRLVILTGNNMDADRHEEYLLNHSPKIKNVLFAFQNSAGHRENGMTVCGRLPVTEFVIGGLHNAASARDKKLVNRALHCRGIKVTWYDDMYAYYLCHIAEIMPYAYLCYRIDCDLTSATSHDIKEVMTASREAFDYIQSIGGKLLPPKEDGY